MLSCWFFTFLVVFPSLSTRTLDTHRAAAASQDQRMAKTMPRSTVRLLAFYFLSRIRNCRKPPPPPQSVFSACSSHLAQPFISTRLDDNEPELLICVTVTEWRKLATLIKLHLELMPTANEAHRGG